MILHYVTMKMKFDTMKIYWHTLSLWLCMLGGGELGEWVTIGVSMAIKPTITEFPNCFLFVFRNNDFYPLYWSLIVCKKKLFSFFLYHFNIRLQRNNSFSGLGLNECGFVLKGGVRGPIKTEQVE